MVHVGDEMRIVQKLYWGKETGGINALKVYNRV